MNYIQVRPVRQWGAKSFTSAQAIGAAARTKCVPQPPLHAARALNESSQNKQPFAAHLPVNLPITQTPKIGAVKPLHAAKSKGLDVRAASASANKRAAGLPPRHVRRSASFPPRPGMINSTKLLRHANRQLKQPRSSFYAPAPSDGCGLHPRRPSWRPWPRKASSPKVALPPRPWDD